MQRQLRAVRAVAVPLFAFAIAAVVASGGGAVEASSSSPAVVPPPTAFVPSRSKSRRGGKGDDNPCSSAFRRQRRISDATTTTTSLRDINEWRDIPYTYPGATDTNPDDTMDLSASDSAPPREICVLPFPYSDVLLQGETKELRLYEERFTELFNDALDNHGGVVAMGLIANSGIIQTVPICEIEAFNRMGDELGIFLTIRAVGRAKLVELTQQEPYIKAAAVEVMDTVPENLELPTIVAGNIENLLVGISALEHRLKTTTGSKKKSGGEDDDGEMQDRIARAKLEDSFYAETDKKAEPDDDDDDEDDDDDDDDFRPLDRTARFHRAYKVAKAADSQGYTVSSSAGANDDSPQNNKGGRSSRSAQDLTALSWAAFCTDSPLDTHGELQYVLIDEEGNEVPVDELEDEDGEALLLNDNGGGMGAKEAMQKVQALDCEDVYERLKLASHMLRDRRELLSARLERRGLGKKGPEEGESPLDEEL